MELDITEFFNEARPADYSASAAELGEHAGEITWNRAIVAARRWNLLDTPDKQAAFRAYIRGFGAWSDAEIEGFSLVELNALLIQFIAGDIREARLDKARFDRAIDCPACDGTGYDANTPSEFCEEFGHSWECQDCDGTGHTWVREAANWAEYEASENAGRLFQGIDGRVYYGLSE